MLWIASADRIHAFTKQCDDFKFRKSTLSLLRGGVCVHRCSLSTPHVRNVNCAVSTSSNPLPFSSDSAVNVLGIATIGREALERPASDSNFWGAGTIVAHECESETPHRGRERAREVTTFWFPLPVCPQKRHLSARKTLCSKELVETRRFMALERPMATTFRCKRGDSGNRLPSTKFRERNLVEGRGALPPPRCSQHLAPPSSWAHFVRFQLTPANRLRRSSCVLSTRERTKKRPRIFGASGAVSRATSRALFSLCPLPPVVIAIAALK